MGKTKALTVTGVTWRHGNAKYCRECNCSVTESRWVAHLATKSHVEKAKLLNRRSQSHHQTKTVVSVHDSTFSLNGEYTIDDQIANLKTQLLMSQEECLQVEAQIVRDLGPVLHDTFGSCQILTFGSMKIGIALKGSDLDVYVDTVNFQYSVQSLSPDHEMQSKVNLCSKALYSEKNFEDILPILGARVPIVTVMHIPTKTSCDISFRSSLGVAQARLLRYYLNLHPRFFDAMLVIKVWAKKHGICNGRDFISSYAWTLMFITYLQTLRWRDGIPIVPSVFELQGNSSKVKTIHDCRVDFHPKFTSVSLPDQNPDFSVLALVTGFFTYYRRFSFYDHVLCPYLGMPISRQWNPIGVIHVQLLLHITALREVSQQGFGSKYVKIVQDPFNHKVVSACPSRSFPKVISCISTAAELCEQHAALLPGTKSQFLERLFAKSPWELD